MRKYKNQRDCRCPNHLNNGFTLIEVLVTLIVMSVGLLSLAGLQVIGLRNNHSAYLRSQATIQSYDIIDRMRVNVQAVEAGNYHQPTIVGSAGTENANCETTAGCTPAEMAAHDLFSWNQAIANVLPGGVALVCIDSTPDDGDVASPQCDGVGSTNPRTAIYTIKIWWDDDSSGTSQQLFFTSFRL